MSERFAEPPAESAWIELGTAENGVIWDGFDERFAFRASTDPEKWPAIDEPAPSITFDLSVIADGPRRGAAYDAINAEALRCFVWALPEVDEWIALDWQHPGYRFRPSVLAMTWSQTWQIPVYPDGDYFTFFVPDMSSGVFGHPWEETLCVFGTPLVTTLGASLATWLPVKRLDGHSV